MSQEESGYREMSKATLDMLPVELVNKVLDHLKEMDVTELLEEMRLTDPLKGVDIIIFGLTAKRYYNVVLRHMGHQRLVDVILVPLNRRYLIWLWPEHTDGSQSRNAKEGGPKFHYVAGFIRLRLAKAY